MTEYAIRFTKRQRLEHFIVMTTFILLAVTGFPQKFFETGWARGIVNLIGGLDHLRFVHRVSGILFSLFTLWHIGVSVILSLERRMKLTMLPNKKDFTDAVQQLRYDLGLVESQPAFDRFDYRQKFEYWGLVLGGLVMISTGLVLYFPMLVTRFLPGELIPMSKVAHSNEGLMAFLVVITWHIYNAHLAPGIFPFDPAIFTGKISKERLRHEHRLEYARLYGDPAHAEPAPAEPAPATLPPPAPKAETKAPPKP
jgi:formate dehydrogenase gamma subunit